LLDTCESKFEPVSIPSRSDALVVFAHRTMKNMVSGVVLPTGAASRWFYNFPVLFDAQKAIGVNSLSTMEICSSMQIAFAQPPCFGNSNCNSLSDQELISINAVLTKTKLECASDGFSHYDLLKMGMIDESELPKTKYLIVDASLRYQFTSRALP
jgi:hypothetical protein